MRGGPERTAIGGWGQKEIYGINTDVWVKFVGVSFRKSFVSGRTLSGHSVDPQNPALNPCNLALGGCERGFKEAC
jgi:hypothetical protein